MIVLSHFQAARLLEAKQTAQAAVSISTDLGLTQAQVHLSPEGVTFPDNQRLRWSQVEEICDHQTVCFGLDDNRLEKIQTFSPHTNRFCSLMPTAAAPTLLIAGFPMHRIKGTDPYRDTLSKIKAIAPVVGRVLDTATGLGYTAIEAAKTANAVITVEIDPTVLAIARRNPYSQALFDHPKITQLIGDSFEHVQTFEAGSFARIVHDPPTLAWPGTSIQASFIAACFACWHAAGVCFITLAIWTASRASGSLRVWRGACKRQVSAMCARTSRRSASWPLSDLRYSLPDPQEPYAGAWMRPCFRAGSMLRWPPLCIERLNLLCTIARQTEAEISMGPLPKRKLSRRRRGSRRSHDALIPAHLVRCDNCNEFKVAHRVCPHCGYYKGRQVIEIEEE